MTKQLVVFVWLGLSLLGMKPTFGQSLCQAGAEPVRFNVAVVHQPFKVVDRQSVHAMISLGGAENHLGLVRAIPKFEVKLQWHEFTFWQRTCYVADLKVVLSHQRDSSIYLRDSLESQPCRYESVLRHERKHEEDHQELLRKAAQVLRLQFESEVAQWKIEPSASTESFQETLQEMSEVFKRFYSENAVSNATQLHASEGYENC